MFFGIVLRAGIGRAYFLSKLWFVPIVHTILSLADAGVIVQLDGP
jgi:hypothetical protein